MLSPIPAADPLPIPAPPSLLWALLMLTFFLHLVAMNFVLGGSIIAAVARLRGDERGRDLAQWLGKLMPTMVAAAVTFGVAPLLFLQTLYGRLFFSSSVLMAWSWFAVVPALILAYYGTYLIAFKAQWARWIAPAVALIFAAIAFIYSNNMSLMLRPETFRDRFAASATGLHLNLADPTLVPRYLHMLLGAIAVAAMIVAIRGVVNRDAWLLRHGALWFALTTCLNVLTGVWWLGVLPKPVMMTSITSPWLVAGIVLGFISLALMAATLGAANPRRLAIGSAATLVATLIPMIFARDEVRREMLRFAEFRFTTWIEPQWGVIAVFAVLLVAALGTTAWMASLLARRKTV